MDILEVLSVAVEFGEFGLECCLYCCDGEDELKWIGVVASLLLLLLLLLSRVGVSLLRDSPLEFRLLFDSLSDDRLLL